MGVSYLISKDIIFSDDRELYLYIVSWHEFHGANDVSAVCDRDISWTFFHHLSHQYNKFKYYIHRSVTNSCHINACDRLAGLIIKACGLPDYVNKIIK